MQRMDLETRRTTKKKTAWFDASDDFLWESRIKETEILTRLWKQREENNELGKQWVDNTRIFSKNDNATCNRR